MAKKSKQGKLFEKPEFYFSERDMRELQEHISKALLVPATFLMTKQHAKDLITSALAISAPYVNVKGVQVVGDSINVDIDVSMQHALQNIGFTVLEKEE